MKKIYSLLLGAVAVLSACHEPEYVSPTAERQGLTSLTAIFTSGPFINQTMAKLSVTDESTTVMSFKYPGFIPQPQMMKPHLI